MYSLMPAIVALFFLAFGVYTIKAKGINHVTTAFCILCVATFFWQFSWAILFLVEDESLANGIINIGWLLILFLPTSLYHFLVEITRKPSDMKYVYASYIVAGLLVVPLLTTNLLIDGHYQYFFGFYPKAGILHPLHMLQTIIVVNRGLYITYKKYRIVQAEEKSKLKYCVISLLIYFFAAIDYLCNYGVEFYPFGVIFTITSLGIMVYSTVRYDVMDESKIISSAIAHEMRTPMATLRSQAELLSHFLPELIQNYHPDGNSRKLPDNVLTTLTKITDSLEKEAKSLNLGVNMLAAMNSYEYLSRKDFHLFSAEKCVREAINRMPDKGYLLSITEFRIEKDFQVLASSEFLSLIIINLVKNSCDAIDLEKEAKIIVSLYSTPDNDIIEVMDFGLGVEPEILPHIFDKYFTTKKRGVNSGVGLTVCQSVMHTFNGQIYCESEVKKFTRFQLAFKRD